MICFACENNILTGTICNLCGAEKKLNSAGNATWFKDGRAISAPIEEEAAYQQRITNYPNTKNIIRDGEKEYANNR